MSDERDEAGREPEDDRPAEDDPAGDDRPPEKDEGGLGLTEEFARIEAEIEQEVGASRDEPEQDEGVRGETGEWAAPASQPDREEAAGEAEADAEEEPRGEDELPAAEEEEPAAEEAPAAEEEPPAPVDAPATEHTVVRPRPLAPRKPASVAMGAGASPPRSAISEEPEAKTPALWWRFLTGSVLIVVTTATAIAVSFLLFLGEVAADLQPIPDVDPFLATLEPGDPQTILILGSDKRSNTPGDPGRSDTTMLLRVDGEDGVLSLFSLPRDLKVDIPGYGIGKLNEAYTVGGTEKTLQTVQELLDIPIHHVVNVDFQGFADAVSAIDCVYVDVDRDYFNDNSGLYGGEPFAVIDVNAGYQRLCGQNALDYVRYRHTDTDIVRAARQQDFLSQARRQVPAGDVIPILGGDTGSDLLDIFTKYTSSDIATTEQVIGTLKAFLAVRNVPIKRVTFEGDLGGPTSTFVTATPEQIGKAVDEFLGGEDTEGPVPNEEPAAKSKQDGKKKGEKEEDPTDGASLTTTEDASIACGEAQDKFAAFGRTSARRLRFPVYVPTEVVPDSCYDDGSRQYSIKDPDDNTNSAYKLVIRYPDSSLIPEYYGVQGTTWADPPILDDPSDTLEIGDRSYDLYYDGDRLARVAWHDAENNSYWLSNTLLGTLDESDMLAIAKSMDEAHS